DRPGCRGPAVAARLSRPGCRGPAVAARLWPPGCREPGRRRPARARPGLRGPGPALAQLARTGAFGGAGMSRVAVRSAVPRAHRPLVTAPTATTATAH